MSMYNLMHGTRPEAHVLLKMLGLEPSDFGRFRDCYLTENGEIAVYTRCGGNNRDLWDPSNMSDHPHYLRDEDDGFDNTYAYIYFQVPSEYVSVVENIPRQPDRETAFLECLARLTKT